MAFHHRAGGISHSLRFFAGRTNGFGSIRVRVRIGESRWATSVFPDKKSGCYLLPVKAAVRKAEGITTGDRVSVELQTGYRSCQKYARPLLPGSKVSSQPREDIRLVMSKDTDAFHTGGNGSSRRLRLTDGSSGASALASAIGITWSVAT
jgi:hypothetical protein